MIIIFKSAFNTLVRVNSDAIESYEEVGGFTRIQTSAGIVEVFCDADRIDNVITTSTQKLEWLVPNDN